MKKQLYILVLLFGGLLFSMRSLADVTITSVSVSAADIPQGVGNLIIYIVKMDVTVSPVTVISTQFTLTGTHDNNDLTNVVVYYNTVPSLAGSSVRNLGPVSGLFAAPHTYMVNNFGGKTITAGSTAYFIITVITANSATNGNTVKLDGNANPVTFGYTTSPIIINNQADAAGTQTIRVSDITLTSIPVPATNIGQGIDDNIIYITKMEVNTIWTNVTGISLTLSGTHDNNDLTFVSVYINYTEPTLFGAKACGNASGTYPAPHSYTIPFGNKVVAQGTSAYFIITASTVAAATSGNTIKIDGTANPVTFSFNYSTPAIINNQTDVAGTQTIQTAAVTISSVPIPASDIGQGTYASMAYIVKIDVAVAPVIITSTQFTLTGTHDNNDLTYIMLYGNSIPSIYNTNNLNGTSGLYAAPHSYSISHAPKKIAAGSTAYIMITVRTSSAATPGNTVKINGSANPVTFGYTSTPNITNNQTDVAGSLTIVASELTLATIPTPASEMAPGRSSNMLYVVQLDVNVPSVTVNSISFTLSGTHDNDDIANIDLKYRLTAPDLAGSISIGSTPGFFAAPHVYTINFTDKTLVSGDHAYFFITVTTEAAATSGNTVKLDGLANPVSFGFTPVYSILNNQTDAAGVRTINGTLPLTLINFTGNLLNQKSVQLRWTTAAEMNTKDFEVEWGKDGLNFNKIAAVPATGNSSQNSYYNYIHAEPVDGNNYYRLKMTDIDGRFTYSPVVNVKITNRNMVITAYPNPVITFLQLRIQADKDENILFKLHSTDGRILESRSFNVVKGNNRLNWNMQQLASGYYFISCGNKQFETIKFIKQ